MMMYTLKLTRSATAVARVCTQSAKHTQPCGDDGGSGGAERPLEEPTRVPLADVARHSSSEARRLVRVSRTVGKGCSDTAVHSGWDRSHFEVAIAVFRLINHFRSISHHVEAPAAHEAARCVAITVVSVGDAVAEAPEKDGGDCRGEEVFEEDVLRGAHGGRPSANARGARTRRTRIGGRSGALRTV
jgi:hypothetical protein